MAEYFSSVERKEPSTRILYPVKMFFRNEEKIKAFSDKEKLTEFVSSTPTLKEWIKDI